MREVIPVKCSIVRGGTSKGIFIMENELPRDPELRDKYILEIFGSPDVRQIDGLGGADVLTSKLAIIGPSSREDADVDYTFGQVSFVEPKIDYKSNCGNISAGVAPFAINNGIVKAVEPYTTVRIHQVNTDTIINAKVEVRDGKAAVDGDFHIDGVPTLGSTIELDFSDSVGGITQTAVCGLPAGVGEPWFDSVESVLSHAVFSVGGVKGIEFGSGFSAAGQRGSQFNDPLRMQAGRVVTATNHNGGVNGGISNGMPVVFQCAVKPTPSIAQPQQTVDFLRGEDTELTIRGRHDPAIIRRICPVLDSVTALALCDLLAQRFGTDYFTKGVQA